MSTTPSPLSGDPTIDQLQGFNAGAAPVAPPAAPPPSGGGPNELWKSVVMGALAGLAGSAGQKHFGGGLGAGAAGAIAQRQQVLENQQRQQQLQTQQEQAQSSIRFQSAQAANAVAEAARNNAIAANLPQEAKDAHDKNQLEMANTLQALGVNPVVVADDTHDGAKGALEALTQSHGGVPHLFNLEVGGKHLAYDLNQLSSTPQGLALINQTREIQGQDPMTAAELRQMAPAARAQIQEAAARFFAPPPSKSAQEAQGLLDQYKAFSDAYSKKPDADPALKSRMDGLVKNLTVARDNQLSQAKELAGVKASAAQAATEPVKQQDKGKDAIEKIWTDPSKGFAAALAQGNQTINSIKAGENGNGLLTSMAPTMEILGVNHAAGINRISPAEMQAAGLPGSFAERWNAWATKAATGQLSPQLASEGKQLMGIVLDAAHTKAVQSSQFIAKNRGLQASNVSALDRNGNLTTLDKAKRITAINPKTNERVESLDGGKTWQKTQ